MTDSPVVSTVAGVPGILGLAAIAAALIERHDRALPPPAVPGADHGPAPWFACRPPPRPAAAQICPVGLDDEIASGYGALIALHRARQASYTDDPIAATWHRLRAERLEGLAYIPEFAGGAR